MYQDLPEEEKISTNMLLNNIEIFLSIGKDILKCGKIKRLIDAFG